MAAENFQKALELVLKHEGGFSDHPHDPGGATNKGITQGTYNGYRKKHGYPQRSVKNITDKEVAHIYKSEYWDKVNGDGLASGVDYAVFDAAVNSGVSRAKKWLMASVGSDDHAETVRRICAKRLDFVDGLSTWKTFGKGWSRRIAEVEAVGVDWARAQTLTPAERKVDARHDAGSADGKALAHAAGVVAVGATTASTAVGVASTADLSRFDWPEWTASGVVLTLAILAALFFFHRWRIERARSQAYEAVASGGIGGPPVPLQPPVPQHEGL